MHRPRLLHKALPQPMRKRRGDSILWKLPPERQAEVAEHTHTHTLLETIGWLKEQGTTISAASLSRFLSQYQIRRQLELNALTVETLLEKLAAHDQSLPPERLQMLGQMFFSELALQQRDPRIWRLMQDIEVKRQRLELDRKKYQNAAKEKTEASPGGITPETLDRIEREIKLM